MLSPLKSRSPSLKLSWPGGVPGGVPDVAAPGRRPGSRPPRRAGRRSCTAASGCGSPGRRCWRRSRSRPRPPAAPPPGGGRPVLALSRSRAIASPCTWSASAWVAMSILHFDSGKSSARIRSITSSRVSSRPTSSSTYSDPPSMRYRFTPNDRPAWRFSSRTCGNRYLRRLVMAGTRVRGRGRGVMIPGDRRPGTGGSNRHDPPWPPGLCPFSSRHLLIFFTFGR